MEAIEGRNVTRFPGRLILKVALATLVPVAVTAGLGFFWEYREDRKGVENVILHEMREEAFALASAVEAAGKTVDVRTLVANYIRNISAEAIERIGGFKKLGLSKIFVVDGAGMVVAGGRPELIGKPLVEALGHGPMGLPGVLGGREAWASEFTVANRHKVVHISVPLRLDPLDPARITGAVHLMEPYALLEEALWPGVWRRAGVAFALTLALAGSLILILGVVVVAPLRRLTDAIRRTSPRGEKVTIPVTSTDEIGEATQSFNQMVAELHRGRSTLEALYAINRAVSESLDVEVVLARALEKACQVLDAEAGGFYLLEADGETLGLRVYQGVSPGFAEGVRRIRLGEGVSGQAMALRQPVAMEMANYPTSRLAPFLIAEGFRSLASAPIIARGRSIGAINLGRRSARPFTEEELDLLGSIGLEVAASIENAQLYEVARREIADRQRAEEEVRKVARFPSENPNPVLRVSNDGVILYANEASESLLRDWKCSVGNPVPEVYRDVVHDVVVHRSRTTLDVQCGEVVYSVVVVPILDAGYVNLYGRDITERKQAEEVLARERDYSQMLVEGANVIVVGLDLEGRITLWNQAAEEISGYTRAYLQGKNWFEVLVPQSRYPQVWEEFRRLTRGGIPREFENPILTASGEERIIVWRNSILRAGDTIVGTVSFGIDITQRKQAEAALVARTRQLEAIRAVTVEIIRELDLPTVLGLITRQAAELVGATVGEISLWDEAAKVLMPQTEYGLGESRRGVPIGLGEGVAGTVAQRREGLVVNDYPASPYTLPFFLARGITAAIGEPLLYGDRLLGALVVGNRGITRPFTDHDRETLTLFASQAAIAIENARLFQSVSLHREQLRSLAARLADAEETQRRRISRELHDRVAQNLTALTLNLNIIRSQRSDEFAAKTSARLEDSQRLVEETVEHIRDVMAELRPPVLDDYGLGAALRWYGERFDTLTGVTTLVEEQELSPRLPEEIETTLFRIAQEALMNVARHARASQVTIRLEAPAGRVRLTIADNGAGFDPVLKPGPVEPPRWGLITMRERAAVVGGQLRVESAPGKGTRVVVELAR